MLKTTFIVVCLSQSLLCCEVGELGSLDEEAAGCVNNIQQETIEQVPTDDADNDVLQDSLDTVQEVPDGVLENDLPDDRVSDAIEEVQVEGADNPVDEEELDNLVQEATLEDMENELSEVDLLDEIQKDPVVAETDQEEEPEQINESIEPLDISVDTDFEDEEFDIDDVESLTLPVESIIDIDAAPEEILQEENNVNHHYESSNLPEVIEINEDLGEPIEKQNVEVSHIEIPEKVNSPGLFSRLLQWL